MITDYTAPSAYPDVTLTVGRLPTAQILTAPTRGAPALTVTLEPSASPRPSHYVIQRGDRFDSIAEQLGVSVEALRNANEGTTTLIPGERLNIPGDAATLLQAPAPTCYETHPGSLLCLGYVENPLDFPVENVSLDVSLLDADGAVQQRGQTAVEQTSIPPGSFAPYRVVFAADADSFSETAARVTGAERGGEDAHAVLVVQDLQGELLNGQVIVSAIIYNPGEQDAQIVRVFVTLLDGTRRVIGYRVLTFEPVVILDAGANLPLQVELTPQVSDEMPEYALYVEARHVP
jgi:LysM repeat protein